ncbi:RtcB family protein [Chitinophaga sp. NPDC101104]|uniref:RtcB family protein n=1 Tax=Chitinophaga sp. NPDC101104 TaxID=3390561 RepID=UPI003D0505DA
MQTIAFYCDAQGIEKNALEQLRSYAGRPHVEEICAFTDIHYCAEKALPVGVAFRTKDYCYPLITGKDIGCGVMYLSVRKEDWLKPFDKKAHYPALYHAHKAMTDDGLGGGNHFLSIEEDDANVYIICHTGTRDRGIALYQECLDQTRRFSLEYGSSVDFVHRDFLGPEFYGTYERTLQYGYERRKDFCFKTLLFLQQANYVRSRKAGIRCNYLRERFTGLEEVGALHGTDYVMGDSIHNHLRFMDGGIVHRKGSTELREGKTAVIPLSMVRGSLLVKPVRGSAGAALDSCAHGAGRRLSRFDAMKHWRTVLKEKDRKAYRVRFPELLDRSGEFPSGYLQEFDYAYKDASEVFRYQPYLKQVTQTVPIVTIKYSEI